MDMHVRSTDHLDLGVFGPRSPQAVARTLSGLLAEVSDEQVELQRPGNRAWVLDQLRLVLEVAGAADPGDPRFLKIRLDALDRIGRILKVGEVQSARVREGDVDRVRLVAAAAAALAELESKAAS